LNAPSRPVRNPLDNLLTTPAQYMVEVVLWTKASGALTKRISLGPDGKTVSNGSECVMCNGTAVRAVVNLQGFKALIESCTSAQAISLGSLRPDLPDQRLNVVTKDKWNRLEDSPGAKGGTVICRTTEFVGYQPRMGLSLIDYDTKGMPKAVDERIEALGGLWPALCSVLPELGVTAHVDRPSTSTGLFNAKTGETYSGSRGMHIYPLLTDVSDNERFLRRFHDRCWLAQPVSLGWMMLGRDGSFLSRSIVDRMVYGPERLSFEGAPVLDEPLIQDIERRAATVYDGLPLDSKATMLDLTSVEK
jgi:hypothetical protein